MYVHAAMFMTRKSVTPTTVSLPAQPGKMYRRIGSARFAVLVKTYLKKNNIVYKKPRTDVKLSHRFSVLGGEKIRCRISGLRFILHPLYFFSLCIPLEISLCSCGIFLKNTYCQIYPRLPISPLPTYQNVQGNILPAP